MHTPKQALRLVSSKTGKGVYASADTLFRGAVFGRDSIEVGEDLLEIEPELVREVILTLARWQGEDYDSLSEAEPGKIFHEHRTNMVDGQPLDATSQAIFDKLSKQWGGDKQQMTYYGSVDSTPLFIRLVDAFCLKYGDELLGEQVVRPSGKSNTVLASVREATEWLIKKLDESESGLLEYQRLNPNGIENQVWKDSFEFYVHASGEPVNHDRPIASIEVQGYVFDALTAASFYFDDLEAELTMMAHELRTRMIELLWVEPEQRFYLGIDYDHLGNLRPITTKTANPFGLLDTGIFDDLPEEDKQKFIGSLVRSVFSKDFLTKAGIRSRALSNSSVVNYWDYHGSFNVWPKETYDIIKGLRRQCFYVLAKQLELRLHSAVKSSRSYPEFFFVDDHGRVLTGQPCDCDHPSKITVRSTNKPEHIQAWTVSAMLAIETRKHFTRRKLPARWAAKLEGQLLPWILQLPLAKIPLGTYIQYPRYHYELSM